MKPRISLVALSLLTCLTLVAWGQNTEEIEAYLHAEGLALAEPADLDPLLERIGAARIVLLGESSHGTAEYYTWRAAISRRLIAEKGFDFIVVEGDWPSCYEVNRYVKHVPGAPASAAAALAAFQRWAQWMWANQEVAELVEWLAAYNAEREPGERVGFFGFDVYSLAESMDAVADYAQRHAPDLAEEIAAAYECLARFRHEPQRYAHYAASGQDCARQAQAVVELLKDHGERLEAADGKAFFNALQNAHVVSSAERHYRAMAAPQGNSWNKRVDHMKATLTRLLERHGPGSRGIVWAHNTHIGDARATDMAAAGMRNIGWLARERYGADEVAAVGFTTHRGAVLAGRQWGADMETMTVPAGLPGSVEDIFSRSGRDQFMVIFGEDVPEALYTRLGHRAKGVVYNPQTERRNYVPTVLPQRYDAMVFIAETSPLTALKANEKARANETPSGDGDNQEEAESDEAPSCTHPPEPAAAAERTNERRRMVETQIAEPRDGRTPVRRSEVLAALYSAPRHVMVPPRLESRAYDDSPLPIGYGQTISQPYIVAIMTELLELSPEDRVLEIGTGSGYQAAVLAHITPHVYSIEIIEPLLDQARTVLSEQGYDCIRLKHGDGYHGWAEHAPYDAIIVTCAAGHVPPPLWEQLAPGGRMVIPIGGVYEVQRLVVLTKQEDGARRSRTVMPVRFVPMTRLEEDGG